MLTVAEPTWVQVSPSGEVKPVSVLPARTSRTHSGAATLGCVLGLLVPLAVVRRWKRAPLPGVTAISALREPAANVSRIMTPTGAPPDVFSCDRTRAVIEPSPVSGV